MLEISRDPMEREHLRALVYSRAGGSGVLSHSACLFLELKNVPGAETGRTGTVGGSLREWEKEERPRLGVI